MDGRELLLLQYLIGDLADRDDEVPGFALAFNHRGHVHAHVTIAETPERGGAGSTRTQRGVERTKIGAQYFGRAHDVVKVGADNVIAARPFAEAAVSPKDRVIGIEQDHAVGHALQNALVLHQPGNVDYFGKVIGIGIDTDEFPGFELAEGPHRGDILDLHFFAEALLKSDLSIMRSAKTKNLGRRQRSCAR
jgi:hypothetical protein